jgi:hypothetical protein
MAAENKNKTTGIRDKRVIPIFTERESPAGKYKGIIELAKMRGLDPMGIGDLLIRKDCPCPSIDCPHKGNCVVCLAYHHMLAVLGAGGELIPRMIIPGCAYFSERDYWVKKRKSTNSPEVKEAIDEWLAYYQNIHNLRRDMCRNRELMEEFDKIFEDFVNGAWMEEYKEKTVEQRSKKIAENKRIDKAVAGAYPYI